MFKLKYDKVILLKPMQPSRKWKRLLKLPKKPSMKPRPVNKVNQHTLIGGDKGKAKNSASDKSYSCF